MVEFATLAQHELASAREKHGPIKSRHEGYAVILEEVLRARAQFRIAARHRDLTRDCF